MDLVSNLNPDTNDSSSVSSTHISWESAAEYTQFQWYPSQMVSNNKLHLVPYLQAFNVSQQKW